MAEGSSEWVARRLARRPRRRNPPSPLGAGAHPVI